MIWLLFFMCFITHFLINPLFKTISSLPTEMASVSVNAFLSGKDWSQLMADTDYYGTGFYILLTPVMMLTDNAYIIHQVTLVVVVLIECIPSILCYKLMRKYLGVSDERYCFLVALALSFFDVVTTSVAINEHPLKLILWVTIYLFVLIGNTDSKKKKIIYTVCISLLLAYSYTIHTRAVVFVLVLGFTIVTYYIVYRKWLVHMPALIITILPLLLVSRKYVKFITRLIWGVSNGSSLTNSDGMFIVFLDRIKELFSGIGLKAFFNIVLGQVFAANIYTAGFALVIFLVTFLVVKKCIMILRKKEVEGEQEINQRIMYITAFCMSAVILMVVGLGIISVKGAIGTIIQGSGAKSYFYLRYFFFYMSPMFMVSMVYLYHHREEVLRHRELISVVFTGIIIYVFAYIVPTTLTGATIRLDKFHYLSAFCLRKSNELLTPADFIKVAAVVLILYIFYYLMLKKNRFSIFLVAITVLLCYQYNYKNLVANVDYADEMYSKIDSFKENVYENTEYRQKYDAVVIYSAFTAQVAQYEMTNKPVKNNPDIVGVNDLILSNYPLDPQMIGRMKLMYVYKLDDNEYVYSKYKFIDFMDNLYTVPSIYLRPEKMVGFEDKTWSPKLRSKKKIPQV